MYAYLQYQLCMVHHTDFTYPNVKPNKEMSWSRLKQIKLIDKQDYVQQEPGTLKIR